MGGHSLFFCTHIYLLHPSISPSIPYNHITTQQVKLPFSSDNGMVQHLAQASGDRVRYVCVCECCSAFTCIHLHMYPLCTHPHTYTCTHLRMIHLHMYPPSFAYTHAFTSTSTYTYVLTCTYRYGKLFEIIDAVAGDVAYRHTRGLDASTYEWEYECQ